jgi:hypothetical protein
VVRAVPIARQRAAKHIPAEANARNNSTSIARQRRGKQVWSTIQAVFSVGSVQSGYKRVEFRSWQFSLVVVGELRQENKTEREREREWSESYAVIYFKLL